MNESISNAGYSASAGSKEDTFQREAIPHLDSLYRFAVRLTTDPTQAEDLVQDTMLSGYRCWHQYQTGTNARAWLMTILRNTYMSQYRKARRAGVPVDVTEIEPFTVFEGPQEVDPEQRFFDQIVDDEILRAIDALPDHFRETLVLSDVEDLSYAAVAQITNVPRGTVKSRLSRARRVLRRKLAVYAEETGCLRQPALAAAC